MNTEIKVSWIEKRSKKKKRKINATLTQNEKEWFTPTENSIRQIGTIVAFTTNWFGKTKAIINCGNNKIVKKSLTKLTVIHKKK